MTAWNPEPFPMDRNTPRPTEIKLHQKSRILEIAFDDGSRFSLPCEYLRVFSPSAEVRGHGPGQEVLQVGKRDVEIKKIEPIGNYAVKLAFSNPHRPDNGDPRSLAFAIRTILIKMCDVPASSR